MCLFNEILVTVVLYCYIIASDYNEVIETHEYSGYGILSIIVLFMFINLLKFFIEVYHEIKTKLPIVYER